MQIIEHTYYKSPVAERPPMDVIQKYPWEVF